MRFLDPSNISRAFRDPITWAALIIDLIPIYAVLLLGWGAAPLVFLYWLENLIIGLVTLARIIASGLGKGGSGIGKVLFMGPFFTVHYGMFCFGHGVMLLSLSEQSLNGMGQFSIIGGYGSLVQGALAAAPLMPTFVILILAFNAFLFAYDFIGKSEFISAKVEEQMFAPYGRIILLHIALFVGMFALINFGEPMLGILALILLRAAWGVLLSVRRRLRLDQKVDGVS